MSCFPHVFTFPVHIVYKTLKGSGEPASDPAMCQGLDFDDWDRGPRRADPTLHAGRLPLVNPSTSVPAGWVEPPRLPGFTRPQESNV